MLAVHPKVVEALQLKTHNVNVMLMLKEKPGDHQNDKDSSSGDHECQILWQTMQLLRYFSLD